MPNEPNIPLHQYNSFIEIDGPLGYKTQAENDLDAFLSTPTGQRWLEQFQQTGRQIIIAPIPPGVDSNNAYMSPADLSAHFIPVDDNLQPRLDSIIFYNPEYKPLYDTVDGTKQAAPSFAGLGHEMIHALHTAQETNPGAPPTDEFGRDIASSAEESNTIAGDGNLDGISQNSLLNDIGLPARNGHGEQSPEVADAIRKGGQGWATFSSDGGRTGVAEGPGGGGLLISNPMDFPDPPFDMTLDPGKYGPAGGESADEPSSSVMIDASVSEEGPSAVEGGRGIAAADGGGFSGYWIAGAALAAAAIGIALFFSLKGGGSSHRPQAPDKNEQALIDFNQGVNTLSGKTSLKPADMPLSGRFRITGAMDTAGRDRVALIEPQSDRGEFALNPVSLNRTMNFIGGSRPDQAYKSIVMTDTHGPPSASLAKGGRLHPNLDAEAAVVNERNLLQDAGSASGGAATWLLSLAGSMDKSVQPKN